jgi:succinoglycan biosynthesis transport protein ExoP
MDEVPVHSSEYIEEINLEKYWLVLKRRWLPACVVVGSITSLGLIYALLQTPQYQASGTVLVKTDRAAKLTGLGDELGRLEALEFSATPLDTQVEVIRSVPVLEDAIQALGLEDDDGALIKPDDLAQGLAIKALPGTDVLSISYQSPDPREAAAIVNGVAEAYIQNNVVSNRSEAVAARSFIDRQLPRAEFDLLTAERQLRQFRQQYQVLMQEGKDFLPSLTELQKRIDNNIVEIDKADSQLRLLQSQLGTTDWALPV